MNNYKYDALAFLSKDSEKANIKLGINTIKKALNELGNPCKDTPAIQIIGTNGKGSIASFIEKILFFSNINLGVTTSPHLFDITERIRINSEKINKKELKSIVRSTRNRLKDYALTPFELIVCCAMQFFDSNKVELLILEAGLGGRLDATTAHDSRKIIAIGKIGLDHKEYLGQTIEEITKEKVAVIEKNSYVVSCNQCRKVEQLINDKVRQVGATITWTKPLDEKWDIGLGGYFQKENGSVAVEVASILIQNGWDISKDHIKKGIAEAKWPGRLETINWKNNKLLVDSAHNPSAAEVLAKERNNWRNEENGIYWIIGVQKKKEIRRIIKTIAKPKDKILLVPVPHQSSWKLKDIEDLDSNEINIIEFNHFLSALEYIDSLREWPDCNPVLTGSIFLVAEFLKHIQGIK